MLQQVLDGNPVLGEAVLGDDLEALRRILTEQGMRKAEVERRRQEHEARINADPYSEENQRLIAEEIQQGLVNENMEMAMEHNPEAFGSVYMLYIQCEVNGVPIKAFVDSGAQSTIMSVRCAERCKLMKLLDRRWAGVAKGVGTARILGRVHVAPMKIGDSFFNSSFTVLEECGIDLLFGLDMLRKHQCQIDLRDNVLRVGDEVTPFLAEKDIPKSDQSTPLRDSALSPARPSDQPPSSRPAPTPHP